jgi:hypothetical protein
MDRFAIIVKNLQLLHGVSGVDISGSAIDDSARRFKTVLNPFRQLDQFFLFT